VCFAVHIVRWKGLRGGESLGIRRAGLDRMLWIMGVEQEPVIDETCFQTLTLTRSPYPKSIITQTRDLVSEIPAEIMQKCLLSNDISAAFFTDPDFVKFIGCYIYPASHFERLFLPSLVFRETNRQFSLCDQMCRRPSMPMRSVVCIAAIAAV